MDGALVTPPAISKCIKCKRALVGDGVAAVGVGWGWSHPPHSECYIANINGWSIWRVAKHIFCYACVSALTIAECGGPEQTQTARGEQSTDRIDMEDCGVAEELRTEKMCTPRDDHVGSRRFRIRHTLA